MISKDRLNALVDRAQQDGIEGDMKPVLQNAVTVGELISVLQQFDPATPVEVEIPVEIDGSETMLSEVAYLVAAFSNPGEDANSSVITLQGCKPELFEAYSKWLMENEELEEGETDSEEEKVLN